MNLPSGEKRGANSPTDPGSGVTSLDGKSTIAMSKSDGFPIRAVRDSINDFPSFDQLGSSSFLLSSGSNGWACPPWAETRYARFFILPAEPENAIVSPSGDQRGMVAKSGGLVNCNRSLPSRRLRHRFISGYSTYATHCPSGEKSSSAAEMPPRNFKNCF